MSNYTLENAETLIRARAELLCHAATETLMLRDTSILPIGCDEPEPLQAFRTWAAAAYGLQVSWPADGSLNREEIVLALRKFADALEAEGREHLSEPPAAMAEQLSETPDASDPWAVLDELPPGPGTVIDPPIILDDDVTVLRAYTSPEKGFDA